LSNADLLVPKIKKSGIYQGYIVLAACFFIMVIVFGSQISFGVFFKPMLNEFGWTRAETSGPFALCMMMSGVLSIVVGRLSDRFGTKIIVSVGGIILAAGFFLMSTITSLWQLYLYFGVLVAAGTSAMYIPLVSLIARWFSKRRGLMSGIGIAGVGFGIGVIPATASYLIITFSWRTSLLIVASINLVLVLVLGQLLKKPQAKIELNTSSETVSEIDTFSGISIQEALKTRQFWVILVAWILYGFFFQVGLVHIVPYATDLKLTAVVAASVLTIIGIVGGFGRISLGFISDRLGNKTTILYSFFIIGVAFLCLSFSSTIWMLYVFAVIFGALCGVGLLLISIIAEYFGFKDLGAISGVVVFANNLGGAISPPLAGAIFDSSGSYQMAFLLCGLFGIISGALMVMLKPLTKRVSNLR
jgi:MFS family permease